MLRGDGTLLGGTHPGSRTQRERKTGAKKKTFDPHLHANVNLVRMEHQDSTWDPECRAWTTRT
jgi:hypothetical protein